MILSRQLKKQSIMIERKFFQNLRYRDMRAEYLGEKKPEYAGRLLSRDLHLTDFVVPGSRLGRERRLPNLILVNNMAYTLCLFFVAGKGLIYQGLPCGFSRKIRYRS